MALHTADTLLGRHPEIARHNLYTAIVCGELAEVERILEERPEAAIEKSPGDPEDHARAGEFEDIFKDAQRVSWEPLLYLSFTRLSNPASNDNAIAIARLLLDRGANPNPYFMAGDSRYTPLVGVIGEGEENRPPHPKRGELARLLMERGAEPFDTQVTYNTHFDNDILWLLELAYEQTVKSGRDAAWKDPTWAMYDMGGYGNGARFMLGGAVDHNDLPLAEWMLAHGANPNAAPPAKRVNHTDGSAARLSQRSLYEQAIRKGLTEMAELLRRSGANVTVPRLEGANAFAAACLRLDHRESRALLKDHPEYLLAPKPMVLAALRDQVEAVELLLELGMSPEIQNPQEGNDRPLHTAAYADSLRVARLLVDRGAEIDPREARYSATPLWGAVWRNRARMIDFLRPLSRDVWALAFIGDVERLREVIGHEPKLAKSAGEFETPLMWLPANEERAIEIAKLFLANGADASVRNRQGRTAADLAVSRAMDLVAELLRAAER